MIKILVPSTPLRHRRMVRVRVEMSALPRVFVLQPTKSVAANAFFAQAKTLKCILDNRTSCKRQQILIVIFN